MDYVLNSVESWEQLLDPKITTQDIGNDSLVGYWVVCLVALIASGVFFFWLARKTLARPKEPLRGPSNAFGADIAGIFIAAGSFLAAWVLGWGLATALTGYQPLDGSETPSNPDTFHQALVIASLVRLLSPLPLVAFLLMNAVDHERRSIVKGRIGIPEFPSRFLWLPMLMVAWIALSIAVSWVARLAQIGVGWSDEQQQVLAHLTIPSDWQLPAAILSAVIAAPISEEFILRAGLFGGLRRHTGFVPAALITTLAFTALHRPIEQPQYAIPVAVLGFTLCWVYECSRNIWFPIALHLTHNAVTLAFVMLQG